MGGEGGEWTVADDVLTAAGRAASETESPTESTRKLIDSVGRTEKA